MRSHTLARIQRETKDGGQLLRQSRASAWLPIIRADLRRIDQKLASIAADFRRDAEAWTGVPLPTSEKPHVDANRAAQANWRTFGGIAAAILEIILAGVISRFVYNAAPNLASGIAVLIALLLAGLFKAVQLMGYRAGFPSTSLNRVERWAWWLFWLTTLGLLALALARTVPKFAPAGDYAIAWLSLSLPGLAGALWVSGFILADLQRHTNAYERRLAERNETQLIENELRQILGT